ncbi:MAG: CBS domain-containing protein [Armatimonadetes bacterium]|nr:CBS domain-containing protein [Armatimonadota bacterium]
MKVMEYMSAHIATVRPDAPLRDAIDKMDLYQLTALPVVDEDLRVLGIVTEADVAKRCESPNAPISECMTAPAISVDADAEIEEAERAFAQHRLKRAPVTMDGRLVGMIGRIELCQAKLGDR